jgi:hypothetical protein
MALACLDALAPARLLGHTFVRRRGVLFLQLGASMLRIDPEIAARVLNRSMTLASLLWIGAAAAALLVIVICVLASRRSRKGFAAATTHAALILLAAVLTGSLTWAYFGSAAMREQSAERSALELRAGQLTAQALAPGSPLACLDGAAGDAIQGACETAVFATPANVAAAIAYVSAQFTLLSDMTDYVRRGGADIDDAMLALRGGLEADPFGFLAHTLVLRDGCTSEKCPALALLHDPSHVRTNIIAQTLDHYVDHYRDVWAKSADVPVADAADRPSGAVADANAPGKRKVMVNIDFPSAASIPPISIMNPEPKTPVPPDPAHKREGTAQTDPVWTPGATPAGK